MLKITDQALFAKVIADALISVNSNTELVPETRTRCVNAVAKAAARIEQSGCFMDFDQEDGRMVIWSTESNTVYEITPDGRCDCKAAAFDVLCWHRVARRLYTRYCEALEASEQAEFEAAVIGAN